MSPFEENIEKELRENGNYWGKDHNYYFHVTQMPHWIWTWLFGGAIQAAMQKPFMINKNERGLELIPTGGAFKVKYHHDKALHLNESDIEKIKVSKPILSFGTYYWMKIKTNDGKTRNWQVYQQFKKDAVKLPDNLNSFIEWAGNHKPWQ